MDLIERYIHDVAQRLPKRTRVDVAAELRSSLGEAYEAAVADFNRESGRMADDNDRETLAADLVKKFGPPAALAASYRSGPQWLIGPELYPAFLRALKIVALVIVCVVGFAVIAGSIGKNNAFIEIMKGLATADILSVLVSAMGWVVLVFWIIQLMSWRRHAGAGGSVDVLTTAAYCGRNAGSWDPRELPRIGDPDRIARTGVMIELAFMIALLLLFALFPRSIGASVWIDGERGWIAILGPGFLENRQLLYVGFAGMAIMNLMLLRLNRWNTPTRIIDIALNCVFIVALIPMVSGKEIIAVTASDLIASGWTPEAAANLSRETFPALDTIVRVVFAGIILGIAAHAVARVVALVKSLGR